MNQQEIAEYKKLKAQEEKKAVRLQRYWARRKVRLAFYQKFFNDNAQDSDIAKLENAYKNLK